MSKHGERERGGGGGGGENQQTVLLAYRVEFSGLALSQMVERGNFCVLSVNVAFCLVIPVYTVNRTMHYFGGP